MCFVNLLYVYSLKIDKMSPQTNKGKGKTHHQRQRPRVIVCEELLLVMCPPLQSQVDLMSISSSQHIMSLLSPCDYPMFPSGPLVLISPSGGSTFPFHQNGGSSFPH